MRTKITIQLLLALYSFGYAAAETGPRKDIFEMSLEELLEVNIGVASRREENINEAPGIISVITSDDIRAYGARNLIDLLSRLPSAVNSSTGRLPYNMVSIRGQEETQYNEHVLYLINGRPVRAHNGGTYAALFSSFPLSMIEQIEVVRGPGSVLYGSGAFAGVVNIKTWSADSQRIEELQAAENVWLSGGYGSFDTYSSEGGFTFSKGDFSAIIAFKLLKGDGERYPFSDRDGLVIDQNWNEDNLGLYADLRYRNFNLSLTSVRREATTMQGGFVWAPAGLENLDGFEHDLLVLSHNKEIFSGHSLESSITINEAMRRRHGSPSKWATEDFQTLEFTLSGELFDKIHYVSGAVVENHDKFGAPPTGSTIPVFPDTSIVGYRYYLQGDYRAERLPDLKVIAGFQWNKEGSNPDNISPRLGLIYDWNDRLSSKFLISDAYRTPTVGDTTAQNTGILIGNPDLKHETVRTYDFSLTDNGDRVKSTVTYYHSTISDVVTRAPTGNGIEQTTANKDGLVYQGVELECKILINERMSAYANANWQTNEDEDTGEKDAANFPSFTSKGGLTYRNDRVEMGLSLAYFEAPPIDESTLSLGNPTPEDYLLVTFNTRVPLSRIRDNLEICLYVDNLLDEDIWYTEAHRFRVHSTRGRPGRSATLELRYNF